VNQISIMLIAGILAFPSQTIAAGGDVGQETVLHSFFYNGTDGFLPAGGLVGWAARCTARLTKAEQTA
jgi:hypothetical protein